MNGLRIVVAGAFLVASAQLHGQSIARRGLAVFSNASFDFEAKALYTDHRNFELADCSDARNVCFRSGPFSFSVPLTCNVRVNDKVMGSMRIIGTTPSDQHLDIDHPRYLLAQAGNPYIVYEFDPDTGIVGLSYDIGVLTGDKPTVNIEQYYVQGRYAAAKGRMWSYSRRLTADDFAACAVD